MAVNQPPVACFVSDFSAREAGQLFTVDASCSSDLESDATLTVEWDWENDGTFDVEQVALDGSFLGDAQFQRDFTELYAYYKDARLLQLIVREGKLLASFQIGERQLPLCARCTGEFYAAAITLARAGTPVLLVDKAVAESYRRATGTLASVDGISSDTIFASGKLTPFEFGGKAGTHAIRAKLLDQVQRLSPRFYARFRLGDWADGVDERFDLLLCNPPYVEDGATLAPEVADWEPAEALYAGRDGLDAFRALAPRLPQLLAPGGLACVEIGIGQHSAASSIFAAAGFTISSRNDLNGVARCLILRLDRG